MRITRTTKIIGTGITKPGKTGLSPYDHMAQSLKLALDGAGISKSQLDGLIAVPSLAEHHFMEAHYFATRFGILPASEVILRTVDTGGAGPVTALLEAKRMIEFEGCEAVAVIAGDSVSSMDSKTFLEKADASCQNRENPIPSPVIPHGYDICAQWQMDTYGLKREHLAMASVLMSRQAVEHPFALTKQPRTLEEVLTSKQIAPVTTLLECARRADGGAAIIVASSSFLAKHKLNPHRNAVILGGSEASGPIYPPSELNEVVFTCEEAVARVMQSLHLHKDDIQWFGLYDCYPICLIRALEAVGLAGKSKGGELIEEWYNSPNKRIPVNTHGGLLSFAAPWETPAMYNIIEAVDQLNGKADARQFENVRRALVYGNGGIFSHSAVAILAQPMTK